MRQTGMLAACAAYALTHNFPQLPRVHALTRKLQAGLESIGVQITTRAETCMIIYDPTPVGLTIEEIDERARALPEPLWLSGSRLVVHIQTSDAAVEDFLSLLKEMTTKKV